MVKLETLRVFTTVAAHGNIKDAAEHLGRTPSAISMTLKQLEDELGSRLFQSDRKSALTALGRFVFDISQDQVKGYDKAVTAIHAYAEGRSGPLTIASVPSVAANLLPALIPAFVAERPDIEIELYDTDSRSVAAMVRSGRVDLGIAGRPVSVDGLNFENLFSDVFKVVCTSTCPLAQIGAPLEWADLAGQPMIMNNSSRLLTAAGFHAFAQRSTLKVHNVTTLLAMTRAGMGITLLPQLATVDLPDDIATCDLADRTAVREVGLITRQNVTPAPVAAAFSEHLHRELAKSLGTLGLNHPRE